MVQRGDFTVAIACVPCGPRRSLIYAWAWGFCVCWKLSAAEQVKTDCCHTPAVVSTLLTPLPVSCHLTTPYHYDFGAARAGWAELPETTAGWVTHGSDRSRQPWWWWPATNTTDVAVPQLTTPASHQHHRRPRLATNTTDVAVPLTTPASHQHHRRRRPAVSISAARRQWLSQTVTMNYAC